MKPTNLDFSYEDLQAELDALPMPRQRPRLAEIMTKQQRTFLVMGMESGKQQKAFFELWASKGWPGTANTLKAAYKEIKEGE